MSKYFIFICFGLLYKSVAGQYSPTILSTEVIPVNPSETDSVYLVGEIETLNYAAIYFGHEIIDTGDTIVVRGCYKEGFQPALDTRKDTFNLGVRSAGHYEILYNVYNTPWHIDSCAYTDSNFVYVPFDVGFSKLYSVNNDFIQVYPNPSRDGKINLGNGRMVGANYIIYDQLGRKIQEGTISESEEIFVENLHGFYFLHIQDESGKRTIRIQIE